MRPKFLVGVIIGFFLIYLSFFGISGFGLILTGTPENLTGYNKVDSAAYLSVTSSSVTATNMPRSAVSYVYKDFGAGHFGDFELQFESQLTAISSGNAFYILTMANDLGPSSGMASLTIGFAEYYDGTTYKFAYGDGRQGGGGTDWITTNPFIMYYFHAKRIGSVATLEIYTSSAYATPVATLTCPIGIKFQYLYVVQSAGVSGTATVTGRVQNLVIAGTSPPPTYSAVTISVSGQGTTSPAVGYYPSTYLVGSSLTITASPASGWSFDYMTRNGATAPSMTLNSLGATEQVVVYFKNAPATTGTLRIFASYNGAYVVASVTASGPEVKTGSTTTDQNYPLALTVLAGTYTVSGAYALGSATPVSVTVPAGGSADAPVLNFGGPSPTPDLLALIKVFFALLPVKVVLFLSGLGSTIGCGIMFMLKGKGERSRPPPQYYSPY